MDRCIFLLFLSRNKTNVVDSTKNLGPYKTPSFPNGCTGVLLSGTTDLRTQQRKRQNVAYIKQTHFQDFAFSVGDRFIMIMMLEFSHVKMRHFRNL